MTKYTHADKGSKWRQWLARPSGATIAGAVATMLIGFLPMFGSDSKAMGHCSEMFLIVTMWSQARESPAQLLAASTLASLTAGGILGLSIRAIVRFVKRSRLPLIARILITLVAAPTSFAISLVVPAVGISLWDDYMASAPPDSALIRNFQRNRSPFARMEQMLQTDPDLGYLGVGDDLPNLPIGNANKNMSQQQRMAEAVEYRSLLQKLDIARSNTGNAENDFCVWQTGWMDGPNDEKGYCYCTTPPANLRGRLDGIDKPENHPSTYFSAYRHIEGNWYLYYNYMPAH